MVFRFRVRPMLARFGVFRAFCGRCSLVAFAALAVPGWAAAPLPPPLSAEASARPKIALVLSGGGARGFAHVGILQALEAARVPVDMVVGTSMGAIIGGLYASGMSPDAMEREILEVDWSGLFRERLPRQELSQRRKEEDFEFSQAVALGFKDGAFQLPQGAVSSRSLELLLRRLTLHTRGLDNFDQLPLPYRAVATDLESGQEVRVASGDLAAAMRASMSVPGVFAPLAWNGRILGDGGLVNNLPVNVARSLGAEVVIAVNIGTPLLGKDKLNSVFGVTLQMINILTEQNVQHSIQGLGTRDLLLYPDLGPLSSTDFGKARELIESGRAYGQSVAASLARFAVDESAFAAWRQHRQIAHQALQNRLPEQLAFVHIEGVDPNQVQRLERLLDVQPGQGLDPARIEQDLKRLVSLDDYARLDYRLEQDPATSGEGLVYELTEDNAVKHRFRLGLDLRTDFQGQGNFQLRLSHTVHDSERSGAQWRTRVELGATESLGTEWYQPLGNDRHRFWSMYTDHELRKIEWHDSEGDALSQFRRRTTRIGADVGWHLGRVGNWGDVRAGLTAARRQVVVDYYNNGLSGIALQNAHWREGGVRLAWVSDQLDHAHFAQAGHRYKFEWQAGHYRGENTRANYTRWTGSLSEVFSHGPHTWNGYLRASRASQALPGVPDEFSLGGFQQLSGYRVGQVAGNALFLARLDYYRKLPFDPGVVARALFLGGTLEAGGAWNSSDRQNHRHQGRTLRLGSSLYLGADTGIGPVYLSLVHAPQGYTGLYFLLGKP